MRVPAPAARITAVLQFIILLLCVRGRHAKTGGPRLRFLFQTYIRRNYIIIPLSLKEKHL